MKRISLIPSFFLFFVLKNTVNKEQFSKNTQIIYSSRFQKQESNMPKVITSGKFRSVAPLGSTEGGGETLEAKQIHHPPPQTEGTAT